MDKKQNFFMVLLNGINLVRLIIVNIIFFVCLFAFLGVLAAISDNEDLQQPVDYGTILEIAPKSIISEQEDEYEWLDQLISDDKTPTCLFDITKAIKEAAIDERIEALYLDFSYLKAISSSHLPELQEALLSFKASKKPIWAYSTYYNTSDYYLASFADCIAIDPLGAVDIRGFVSESLYFKEMEEKWGIKFQTFHAGECKGAVEAFSRTNMSSSVKDNIGSMLFDMWKVYLKVVSENREKREDQITNFATKPYEMMVSYAGNDAKMALGEGMVSLISTQDDFRNKMKREISSGQNVQFASYISYVRSIREKEKVNKIGVIYLTGAITNSRPAGRSADVAVASDIEFLFEKAISDDRVKAIVLRIDSGGGEVFASEIIRRSVQKAKDAGKPVVVSMASVAASGAYWVSSSASYIFATPLTITGSIGVFAVLPNFHKFLNERVGITTDSVGVLENTSSSLEPLSEEEIMNMNLGINATYDLFLDTVSSGREMDRNSLLSIASGKVYSGMQAKELGLVDEIGSFANAIDKAAELANIESFNVLEIKKPENKMNQIMKAIVGSDYGKIQTLKAINELLQLKAEKGVFVYSPIRLMWEK